MTVIIGRDLLFGSRIASIVERAGGEVTRCDDPAALPSPEFVTLVLGDWAERRPDWGGWLAIGARAAGFKAPRVVLFGPHTDLGAHEAARAAGLGPMLARSKVLTSLVRLLAGIIRA